MQPDRKLDFVSGEVFAVDKPLRWTSFDAVKRLRGAIQRRLGVRKFKVGHAGTLDPLATGVLIICTGKATKLIDELQSGEKEYIATLKLGATTPSFDLETEIDSRRPWQHITEDQVREALGRFRGQILQVLPVYSAVKIDGKRAYKFARKGKEVELKSKAVSIPEIELISFAAPEATIRVVCSKGTYIRALARDIGEDLGCGAHLTALRRIRVGRFSAPESSAEGLGQALSIDEALEIIGSAELSLPDEWLAEHPLPEKRPADRPQPEKREESKMHILDESHRPADRPLPETDDDPGHGDGTYC